ncbi:MAG TPA: Lrp/AsnC family transcriptional regulator [Candidatus Competibacter sp.]|nr:Lrp/AsnC family transcriptional regulator [Candidatus Competibacteraceae bacterium]HRE54057.1 Lrp/AsnC family transcriptional regulator [Candidatus Competibacter sp.]HUM95346.1 Lrp/AsnC family transcriptional regulator [Candidatus Competibacter sp.]
MDAADFNLLNRFQRDFPLVIRPFRRVATLLGCTENDVLAALRRLQAEGKISRVGAVFATRRLGVSTLAALAAPPGRLEAVAAVVNDYPEVNHNYQRENAFNLWFVLTAASRARLQAILADIEQKTGLQVLDLPVLEEFHIDLGFDLRHGGREPSTPKSVASADNGSPVELSEADRLLLAALQPGLPLLNRPYCALARQSGLSERQVVEKLRRWLQQGLIKRLGVIVRHRELGYRANAMVVWDIPDADIGELGRSLAAQAGVNLCYRRPRRLPDWPYNLFCMVHGRERGEVLEQIERLRAGQPLQVFPHSVLFSTRCFRQRGAYYLPPAPLPDSGKEDRRRLSRFEAATWTS